MSEQKCYISGQKLELGKTKILSPFRTDFLRAAHGWGAKAKKSPPLPKICRTYPTMMKLDKVISYLKKISKKKIYIYIYHVTHHFSSADLSIFSQEISNFCYIKKRWRRFRFNSKFLILLTLVKVFLINMFAILMMSEKLAALGLLKVKLFCNKGHDVIISVYDVISKILSRDSNYIVNMAIWLKICNSSNSMREVILTSIL